MDKHLRLLEMMPSDARPKGLGYTELGGWTSYGFPMDDHHAHALIEHAARLYYEGEAYRFNRCSGRSNQYFAADVFGWESDWLPLIDALLAAAAEHAREVGEGGK